MWLCRRDTSERAGAQLVVDVQAVCQRAHTQQDAQQQVTGQLRKQSQLASLHGHLVSLHMHMNGYFWSCCTSYGMVVTALALFGCGRGSR